MENPPLENNLSTSSSFSLDRYLSSIYTLDISNIVLDIPEKPEDKDYDKHMIDVFTESITDLEDNHEWFEKTYSIFLDLLMRRLDIEQFLTKIESIQLSGVDFSQIDARCILILLMERSSSMNQGKLVDFIKNSFYGVPFLYNRGDSLKPEVNYQTIREPLLRNFLPLITSYSLESVPEAQDVLADLLGMKDSLFTRSTNFKEAGEFYFRLKYCDIEYIVADMHHLPENAEEANEVNWNLARFSSMIIVNFSYSDLESEALKPYLKRFVEENRRNVLLILHDAKKNHKKFPDPLLFIEKEWEIPSHLFLGQIQLFPRYKNHPSEFKDFLAAVKHLPIPPTLDSIDQLKPVDLSAPTVIIKGFDPAPFEALISEAASNLDSYKKFFNTTIKKKTLKDLKHGRMNFLKHSRVEETVEQALMYERECDLIENELRNLTSRSELVEEFLPFVSRSEPHKLFIAEKIIDNYKKKFEETIKSRIQKLNLIISNTDDINTKEKLEEEILELRNYALSTEAIIQEYASIPRLQDSSRENVIEHYLKRSLMSGGAINLVSGMTLNVGNEVLRKIVKDQGNDLHPNCMAISIIGFQSGAKSTLMNYLFGTDFTVSAGRCTKGLYFCLKRNTNDENLIVLDSEGLFKDEYRDPAYNNLVVASLLTVSHVMIINLRGEGDINKLLKNLMEICVVALQKLQLIQVIRPTIIFAMRDMTSQDKKIQLEYIEIFIEGLEKTTRELGFKLKDLIDFSFDDVFLFPNSFTVNQNQTGFSYHDTNKIFSNRVADLRTRIFSKLRECNLSYYKGFKQFYQQFDHNWHQIEEEGENIIKLETPEHYKNRGIVYQKYLAIDKVYIEMFREEAEKLFVLESELEFNQRLEQLYDQIRQNAREKVEKEIYEDKELAETAKRINLEEKFLHRFYFELQEKKREYKADHLPAFLLEEKVDLISKIRQKVKEINMKISGGNRKSMHRQNSDNAKSKDDSIIDNPELKDFINEIEEIKIKEINEKFSEIETKKTSLHQALTKSIEIQMKKMNLNLEYSAPKEVDLFERSRKTVDELTEEDELEDITLTRMNSNTPGDYANNLFKKYSKYYDVKSWILPQSPDYQSKLHLCLTIFQKFTDQVKRENCKSDSIEEVAKWIIEKSKISLKMASTLVGRGQSGKSFANESVLLKHLIIEAMYIHSEKSVAEIYQQIDLEENEIKRIVEREKKYLDEMFTFKDEFQKGICHGTRISEQIIDTLAIEYAASMELNIRKKLKSKYPTPEVFNIAGYNNAFTGSKSDIIDYIENPILFLENHFRECYLHEFNHLLEMSTVYIREKLNKIMKNLALNIRQQDLLDEKFVLDELYVDSEGLILKPDAPNMRFKFDFNTSIANSTFWDGFKEAIIDPKAIDSKIFMALDKLMKGYMTIRGKYVGCQQRCPTCGAKCMEEEEGHFAHRTSKHLIMAFKGESKSRNALVRHCFDEANFKNRGYKDGKLLNYLRNEHDLWFQEFSRVKDSSLFISVDNIPKELKGAWALTHDYFKYYYHYKTEVPKEWEDYAEVNRNRLNFKNMKETSLSEKLMNIILPK